MADVTRGQTFGATEEVTNTKLHNLVDAAAVTNIDKDDADSSTTSFIHIGSTSPSAPYTGLMWLDTSTNILKRYTGSTFEPVASADSMLLTNKSGGQVVAGDVVVVDTTTDESFTTTTTANDQTVIGVALETISDDAAGTIAFSGKHNVNLVAAGTRGQFIQAGGTAKTAQQSATQDGGTFGVVMEGTGGAGLAACVLFGGNNFSLTNDEIDAINGAATPSSSNVFRTMAYENATDETGSALGYANASSTATHSDTVTLTGLPTADDYILTYITNYDVSAGTWRIAYTGTCSYGETVRKDVASGDNDHFYITCIGGNGDTIISTWTELTAGTITDNGQLVSAVRINA